MPSGNTYFQECLYETIFIIYVYDGNNGKKRWRPVAGWMVVAGSGNNLAVVVIGWSLLGGDVAGGVAVETVGCDESLNCGEWCVWV